LAGHILNRGFSAELRRLLVFTSLCVCFGLLNGYLVWSLIIGGAAYMSWMMWQIYRLDLWLNNSHTQQPPDASGIWGDIFDNIVRLQKRQRREKGYLQSLVKRGQDTTAALRDGVLLLDGSGNIEWFNAAAQQLLSLRRDDMGHPLVNYIRHPKFIAYFEGGDHREMLELASPQSESVHLQYQLTRFGRGEHLLMIRDISRLYNLEQMRKDFVANVSHELRTPLTVIRGYVETLQMSPDLPERWNKALSQMEQQGLRMTNLLNDLLSLSKLETDTSEYDKAPVNLQALLCAVKDDAQALSSADEHVIRVECAADAALYGNEKELHSAFSNLAFNAVKYSPACSSVCIRVEVLGQSLQVVVEDEGPGIDPIHIPRLTERFYRVDSSRHASTGGTGLGLAIVKHVLLRHNAKLEIDSELGRGSRFVCEFPEVRIVPVIAGSELKNKVVV